MLKLMILGRRAPGRSRAQAQHHLKSVHGRLVLLPPPDAGAMPADYTQNHVIDGAYPAAGAHAIERDLLTEIWFDDLAGLKASTQTPYYLANLRPDEPRFVDDPTVERMLVKPSALIDGPRGPHKAFALLTLDASAQADIAACLSQSGGLGALVRNDVLPPPDGSPAFVDVVFEAWFADAASARDVMEGLLGSIGSDAVDRDRSVVLLAEEFTTARLMVHYATA